MSSKLSASASAAFSAGSSEVILKVASAEGVVPLYGEGMVDVWCSEGTPTMQSTSGYNVRLVNNSITQRKTETLTFQNSTKASLSFCNLTSATVSPVGVFLSTTGARIATPSMSIDLATGEITSAIPCFGAVSVDSVTTFARYACNFALDPNATEGDPLASPPVAASSSEFAAMLIAAFRGDKSDSVTLSPPSRKGRSGSFSSNSSSPNNGGTGSNIVIEVIGAGQLGSGIFVVPGCFSYCSIAVYYGNVLSVLPAVSQGAISMGYYPPSEFIEIVNEPLNWANQSSVSLKYLPVGTPQIVATSSKFIAKYQDAVSPTFISGAGRTIRPKVYNDGGAYTIGDEKVLKEGEVVVAEFGLAVDCTGSALASYVTKRSRYDVMWPMVDGWFTACTVSVMSDGYSGSAVLNPPDKRGNK